MLIKENTKVTINLVLLVTLIIGLIGSAVAFGRTLENYDVRIEFIEEKAHEHEAIRKRINDQDIALVEIQTDLKWIRKTMEERYQ